MESSDSDSSEAQSPRSGSVSRSPSPAKDDERGNEAAKAESPRSRSTPSPKSDNEDDKESQSGDEAMEVQSPPSPSGSRSRSSSSASAKSDSEPDEKEAEGDGDRESEMQSPTSPPRSKPFAKLVDSDSEKESDDERPRVRSPHFTPSPKSDEEKAHKASDDEKAQRDSDEDRRRGESDDENKEHKDSDEDKERKDSDDERVGHRDSDDDAKPGEVEEPLPETRIDVEIPKITTDLGKSVHFVKLPNFLSVETRPFDPNTYEDEIDDEETLDEEGRARLKLKVENTIRWREKFDEKGVFVKESNARFVRWSDGSLSLHLGDEIFNVERQALHGDHNHLFIRQGTGLQGQAVFRTKLTFRPHSTESFTHRKMTMSLADRSTKAQGIKVLSTVGADPEAHRDVLIKKEEDRLKASVRRENKQRRVRERGSKGLSTSYLDDDGYSEEENSISLAAIKNKYKKGGSRAHIYSTDEDDGSDLEQGRRLEKAKRLKDSEDEEEGGGHSDREGPGEGSAGKPDSPVPGPSSAITSSVPDSD